MSDAEHSEPVGTVPDKSSYGATELTCRVVLRGATPPAPQLVIDKNVEHCGSTMADPVLLITNGCVENALVWIDVVAITPSASVEISIRAEGCQFNPRVQVAPIDSILVIGSGDDIMHNPHGWWNGSMTVFNVAVLDARTSFRRRLSRPGLYRIDCDTHQWMKAYVLVCGHPFAGVTDRKGEFTFKGIPPGAHELRVWHEVLGEQSVTVSATGGECGKVVVNYDLCDRREASSKPKTMVPWPPDTIRQASPGDDDGR